jgi:hypothetical protein
MAGTKNTRIDYGDKAGVTKNDDKLSHADPQDSSVPKPMRAGVPVGGSENEKTSSESAAKPTTRPNTSAK